MGTDPGSDPDSNGWSRARGLVLKTLVLIGGAVLLKRLTKSTTRWDHTRIVAQSLSGVKRFFMVKPCAKEMKCDVEVSTYAIRDAEEYKNFCDRSKDQRPPPEEVIGDIAEHLTTVHLNRCERGKSCLYEGSTPPDGFPNSWVWGVKGGPYEFKPAPASSFVDMFSPLTIPPLSMEMEKRIEGSFVLQE
ncbi:hypothetical protein RHGRI_035097 [Rhododendron griersonianum]|uniref:Uncharacterized protein n=1 Tax=Rhododendron griersonianum TaxID=479676 RepID=A0AAV6I3B8_9ERIC|nr:hypothetical protein RHGRI_035097 [Rhododendron griersonianum]